MKPNYLMISSGLILLGLALATLTFLKILAPTNAEKDQANQTQETQAKNAEKIIPLEVEKRQENFIYQKVNSAVVTVYGAKELGSGMIMRTDGLVLTNKHVIENSISPAVKTATGEVYEAEIVDFDLRYDLAIMQLKTKAIPIVLPTITLENTLQLRPGDRVYAIGSPGGKAGTMTTGTFLRTTEQGSLQLSSGLLSPGNSGGPLLNANGEVVGINKGVLKDNSGLATSVTAIKELLSRYDAIRDRSK
ncbi:trypsin-like peptidase domain-containing protein [Phormidium sp. CLA17]|uniref:S1C family serine protease n=1 Tax=Leptolyngbya sp. Cla-17 TaxID=2803751 RepID=UPI0014926237|nr:serine protease [Leptolyngbya sp. Cla-17]MBM0741876.1 trypsin-like peptidase domain-containing protein [Leptolyngbya sp. Cla-17]